MELTATVQAWLEDRLAIEDLFFRYAAALDNGDVEGILSCFSEDAEMASPTVGSLRGREDGIRSFATRFSRLNATGSQTRHCISNIVARVDGETARASAYLLCGLTQHGRSEMLPPGRYDCDLVRIEGQWVFRRRVVTHDAPFTIAGI